MRFAILVLSVVLAALPAHAERRIEFSGYEWLVRQTREPEGPGPNRFVANASTVWVDEEGALHLRIWERAGRWFCAEVILNETVGYGTYEFTLEGDPAAFDPTVILGFFTYDVDSADAAHREIDVELGRFGSAARDPAQYVVQPAAVAGNVHVFDPALDGTHSTHGFRWSPGRVDFRSVHGHVDDLFAAKPAPGRTIAEWSAAGSAVPEPGDEQLRINLWLYEGVSPGREHEVVIPSVRFTPLER
jgi:hypothetical protein